MSGDVEENPGPSSQRTHTNIPCDGCKKTIRAPDHLKSALMCAEKGCTTRCHRAPKCSMIKRYSTKDHWKCSSHNPLAKPAQPAQPADPETSKVKKPCAKKGCPTKFCRKNEFQCCKCQRYFHQSCTGILSRAVREQYLKTKAPWTCPECEKLQNQEPPTIPEFAEDTLESGKIRGETKQSLRIVQWNADSISTKILELQDRLTSDDIDVCLVQETKLKEGSRTPKLEGYTCIRADRKLKNAGGGLLILIKSSIIYEQLDAVAIEATESLSIKVRMDKRNWIYITNVYIPPCNSIGQDSINLRTDSIPTFNTSLICGDFNAHHSLWDDIQPADERGEQMVDWAIEKELTIMNDNSTTRVSRTTGNESSPDVELCGAKWAGKFEWSVGESIGSSDHLPIYITINSSVKHQSVFGKRPRWRSNGVHWADFTKEVEEKLQAELNEEGTLPGKLASQIRQFTDILLQAGHKHIGKVKPGRNTRVWLTPPVRAAIRQRNNLRRKIKTHRREWIEQCKAVKEEINIAKQQKWRDIVEDAIDSADDKKIWSFIKSISGTTAATPIGEVMTHHGRRLTSSKAKANIFSSHYASVSRLKFNKDERATNRAAKQMLRSSSVDDQSCRPLTMPELKKAIARMRARGAPGPDDIPPTFIKALGQTAQTILLQLFNTSFDSASIPQEWRNAIIIPLLKLGKAPSSLSSYRPVSLTSCLVKTLERTIADRLYYITESSNMLSNLQAGFRSHRSCEDQILKITQLIEDGFQRKKCERSVLALLDYSKAFDQVWRQKLLLSMHQKNIPMKFIRWLNCFLSDRQAKVQFANTTSRFRPMRQGLPQGSVLSPLLFILFINNLAEILPENAHVAMFADDVTLLATHRDKKQAERELQDLVDIVAAWSKEWKLTLNADKCEICFFTTSTNEAKWSPSITIDGKQLKHEPNPRLLGVTLDRQLCFGKHVDNVTKSATNKLKVLSKLSYSDWGSDKFQLFRVYQAVVRSRLDYSASAWQPWISTTQMSRLETVQNKCLRAVTGQTRSTPVEALRLEAGTSSYATISKRLALTSYEKAARLPRGHPRRELLEKDVPKRNTRTSWRSTGNSLSNLLPNTAHDRDPIAMSSRPPWIDKGSYSVATTVPGVNRKGDLQPDKLREAAIDCLKSHHASTVIYTDGSASAGTKDGGSAAIIATGDFLQPGTAERIMQRGAPFTSSFEEELQAMHSAVNWCIENQAPSTHTLIATDSQSLCQSLLGNSPIVDKLKRQLDLCAGRISIQWIPGHADIPGNELADAAAKEAASAFDTVPRATSIRGIMPAINSTVKDEPPSHTRTAAVYSQFSIGKEQTVTKRADQTMLARIRSGHSMLFKAYKHRVTAKGDPRCNRCSEAKDDTLEHWLDCAGTAEERMRNFGTIHVDLPDLTRLPRESVALARKTLFRGAERC